MEAIFCSGKDSNYSTVTTQSFKISPLAREACVITLSDVILVCNKEILYFSHETVTKVQSRKRCPLKGSCVGRKCGAVNATTLVSELSEANAFPGITYCTESCGFWGCNCGSLFRIVYKKPVSTEIYEIFQCPTWYETVNVSLEISFSSGKTRKYFLALQPNVQKTIFR
ncbi:hypothetical protein OSTOST_17711 [Ostertagia ostertagi]